VRLKEEEERISWGDGSGGKVGEDKSVGVDSKQNFTGVFGKTFHEERGKGLSRGRVQ